MAATKTDESTILVLPREKHESARVWCHRVLLHNIIHLRLLPGESVAESELRELMGVSRTPVREALMQLSQENFVRILPQKGTYVSRIDMSQVLELRYIRRCAEAETARAAAAAMTPGCLAELTLHMARQKTAAEAQDIEGFIAADDALHGTIYRAAGKEGVWDFFTRTNLPHFRSRILGLRVSRALPRLLGEHRALVAALRARDADKAEAAVRTHLSDTAWNADSVREVYPDYFDLQR